MKQLFTRVFCILLCFGFYQEVKGQAALVVLIFGDKLATEKFHLSIDMGLGVTSLSDLTSQERKINPYFGMGTFIKLNDKWAVTPEFKPLSPKGAKNTKPVYDYSSSLNNPEYKINLNYIDVPVLLQYKITKQLFVSAGPQISFLTGAKQQSEGESIPSGKSFEVYEDVSSTFNPYFFQVPIEIGYSLSTQVGGKGVDFKVRYNIGVSDMIADPAYGSCKGSSLLVFLSFPFIKAD